MGMGAKVYGGERRWLAGCLLLTGGAEPTFQLRPLNVFFTEKPDEEMPDLCLETFGLAEKGPEWDGQCVKDRRSRVLPVKFGKSDSNSPDYCIKKCKSHEYSYAGVEYSKECFCGNPHLQRRTSRRRATATGNAPETHRRPAEAAGR